VSPLPPCNNGVTMHRGGCRPMQQHAVKRLHLLLYVGGDE
jgi:hypothetical protein